MSKPKDTDAGYRRILPGACTWCGHRPHDGKACRSKIRTRDTDSQACPCARSTRQIQGT